jgi:hypothetical protein
MVGADGGVGGSSEPHGDLPPIGRPAAHALVASGVSTLAESAALGRRRLLALHGVGPKAVEILASAAESRGILFGD